MGAGVEGALLSGNVPSVLEAVVGTSGGVVLESRNVEEEPLGTSVKIIGASGVLEASWTFVVHEKESVTLVGCTSCDISPVNPPQNMSELAFAGSTAELASVNAGGSSAEATSGFPSASCGLFQPPRQVDGYNTALFAQVTERYMPNVTNNIAHMLPPRNTRRCFWYARCTEEAENSTCTARGRSDTIFLRTSLNTS